MKVLSLYDGMSCGMIAFKELGVEVESYDAYEIDKYAIQVSTHNFPEIKHHGDVFKGDFTQYQSVDWVIGGSPCFTAGTMVMTKNGLKPIEDVAVGDEVLTHKNRFKSVKETMSRVSPSTVIVKAENCGEIECTKEHPFYTKDIVRVFNSKDRTNNRILDKEFCWTDPEHFRKIINNSGTIKQQTYLTSATENTETNVEYNGVDFKVNQTSTRLVKKLNLNDKNFWYIIGRWLGDGWFNYKYTNKKKLSGIKICCGKSKATELEDKIKLAGFNYCKSDERTVCKFTITNLELALYLKRFGGGASGKRLAKETFFLPKELALSLLDGYFGADGHINGNVGSFTTVSKELAYGIKYMINKYMKVPCCIARKINHSNIIEGRKINVKDIYIATFPLTRQKQSHYFVEDNYIIAPFKSVTYLDEPKTVYNLSVEDDESYTANGLVVHNCTYWSIAQKNNRETEASGLGWELFSQYVRAVKEAQPKYFLYENNKSMSKEIRASIDEAFGFEAVLINSALVSAQNRQRLYWVGRRNEDGTYSKVNVEQPKDRGILLKDVLDGAVAWQDKSYCITTRCSGAIPEDTLTKHRHTMVAEPLAFSMTGTFGNRNASVSEKAYCLAANPSSDMNAKCIEAVKVCQLDTVYDSAGRIYNTNCKCICLDGDSRKFIIDKITTSDGKSYPIYEVKDGLITIKDKQYPIKLADGYYIIRKLTVSECKRLQTIPDWYDMSVISNSQAYKCLGNGWTVEVIKHLIVSALNQN